MNDLDVRHKLLSLPEAGVSQPFGAQVDVFKVNGKMFALLATGAAPKQFSLKADPDEALRWRAKYKGVIPGYHLNKRHWNSMDLDGTITDDDLKQMIQDSFLLVLKKLKASDRKRILSKMDPNKAP